MSTTKKANTKATTTENTPSQIGGLDAAGRSPERKQKIKQMIEEMMPELEHLIDEFDLGKKLANREATANADDATIRWNLKLIRGKDTVFFHIRGSSTLNRIFSPQNIGLAHEIVMDEITNKIAIPAASAFLEEANRRALEITGSGQDEDLAPLT